MYEANYLRSKVKVLESIDVYEESDLQVFRTKLKVLKEIAIALIEEVEALEFVRSVNLRRGISLPEELRHFEIHLIQSALERTGGHQTRAAQLLGINLTTLHNKLKRLEISPDVRVDAPVLHENSDLLQATEVLA
jgi:DNA-binding NtrC family response regulator